MILAGITIAQITGNDNTMDKAKEAVDKDAITNEKETIELAVVNITSKTNNISEVDENELESELSNSTTSITKNDGVKVDLADAVLQDGTKARFVLTPTLKDYNIVKYGIIYKKENTSDYNDTNARDMLIKEGIEKVCASTTGALYGLNVTPVNDQRIWALGYITIQKYGLQATLYFDVKSAKVSELQNQNN